MNPPTNPESPPTRVLRATKLIDSDVCASNGEKIGEVEDLMIDRSHARAAYAIVSFGGLFGFGEKHFALPFPAIHFSDDDRVITLDVARNVLERAPNFSRNAWPTFDRAYGATIYDYYDTPLYWTARLAKRPPTPVADDALENEALEAHGMVRASATIGTPVFDAKGGQIGPIDDVVFDAGSGRIVYVVLSIGGFLGMGDQLFAIPGSALRRGLESHGRVVLDGDQERLARARGFDRNRWPDLADRRLGLALHAYWGQTPWWDAAKTQDAARAASR